MVYTFSSAASGCPNTDTTTIIIETPAEKTIDGTTTICTGTGTNITVELSDVNTSYQLRIGTTNVGSPVQGTGSTILLPTGNLTATTTFNVFATTNNGCTKQLSTTVTVTVTEQPTASAPTGVQQIICAGQSATVNGASSSNGTILWTRNGAGTISNETTLTPTYTAAAGDGTHDVILTLHVSNSPCNDATATYTIHVNALPNVQISQSYICIGSTASILTPNSNGIWVSSDNNIATVTNAGVVTGISAGSVTFTFTSFATGCSNTTSPFTVDGSCQVVTLTQPPALSATITQDGVTTICSGAPTTILVSVSGGTAPYAINGQAQSGNGPFVFTVNPTNTTTFDFSNIIVSDAHNCTSNSTTGFVSITVNHAPLFDACPSNQVVSASGTCDAVVNYTATVTGDPTPDVSYEFTGATTGSGSGTGSGSTFNLGVTTVTITAHNICSPDATCSFTITVNDDEAPVVTCPVTGNADRNADAGVCSYTVQGTEFDATATDNCTLSTLTYTLSGATTGNGTTLAGVIFGSGQTTVTWTGEDAAGNSSSCSFTVTVLDNQPPAVTCPVTGNADRNADAGVCSYTVQGTEFDATATDNCGVSSLTYILSGATTGTGTNLAGVIFGSGQTTVTWTAGDAAW